jgi:uncharacterized protein
VTRASGRALIACQAGNASWNRTSWAGNSSNLYSHPVLVIKHRRHDLAVGQRQRPPRTVAQGVRVDGIMRRQDSDLDLLVDFEPGTSLLDHVGLFQDLDELLGVGVDVVARCALKPQDDHIRAEAVEL